MQNNDRPRFEERAINQDFLLILTFIKTICRLSSYQG